LFLGSWQDPETLLQITCLRFRAAQARAVSAVRWMPRATLVKIMRHARQASIPSEPLQYSDKCWISGHSCPHSVQ
jgi:hypothetical protein